MNRRVRKSILKDAGMPPQHVDVMVPPDIKPMVKEFKVGRNDPCPCGKTITVMKPNYFMSEGRVINAGDTAIEIPVKYKNCCAQSGTYENYK